jgi:DNA mismatch endonuclease (patch repair protein)
MRAVKSKDTTPELIVRRLAHGMGYRYRLHDGDLPGKPDLVFSRRRKIIFVHGCFWHGHDCPRGARLPKANSKYWQRKITRNAQRDAVNIMILQNDGWKVMTIWECETKAGFRSELARHLRQFLN